MMTRMLICYFSKSGTTQTMAEEIYQGAEESEVDIDTDLKEVQEVDAGDLSDYDGIILGSPTYYGLPAAEIKELLDESVKLHGELEGVVGGAFSSSANPAGGNETTIMSMIEALLIHGMVVKGMSKDDHYGPVVIGEPDDKELEHCRYYGRWMAEFTGKVSGWNSEK